MCRSFDDDRGVQACGQQGRSTGKTEKRATTRSDTLAQVICAVGRRRQSFSFLQEAVMKQRSADLLFTTVAQMESGTWINFTKHILNSNGVGLSAQGTLSNIGHVCF